MLPRASSSEVSSTARSRFVADQPDRLQREGVGVRVPLASRRSPRSRASARPCRSPRRSAPAASRSPRGRGSRGRGTAAKSAISTLMFSARSLTTAAKLASEPVPAVVGIAASGASGSGAPGAVVLARKQQEALPLAHASPPWVKSTFAALAVSITEPPPTREEAVRARLLGRRGAGRDDVGVRVLGDLVEDARHLEAAIGDPRLDPLDQPGGADHLVGDHERPLGALLGELEARRRRSGPARRSPGWARLNW